MQELIVTVVGIIVVFGLPTLIVRHISSSENDDGLPALTYGTGLMWFLLVGGLGFAYVGVSVKFGSDAELFAEIIGIIFIYIFLFYLAIGVPVLIVYLFRLLR